MSAVKRPLPIVTKDSEAFWRGGVDGKLHIYRCLDCQYYVHPPVRFCPHCESRKVEPQAVSGKGIVASYTVNHQQWFPDIEVPYVFALVELAEDASVRIPTNIINCPANDVQIGMKVRVLFEKHEDVYVPFFEPDKS